MFYTPGTYFEGTNFTHTEVANSSTADRLGIDNTPGELVLEQAELVALGCLQRSREHFGIGYVPNSWFRCELLERSIAGKGFANWATGRGFIVVDGIESDAWKQYFARKQHPKGNAVDHEIPGVDNDELFEWYKANVEFDQLIREFAKPGDPKSGWVHISLLPSGNRNQAFAIP